MLDLTAHWTGITALMAFIAAYVLVVAEQATKMRKSKPVMLAAGLIWALLGIAYARAGQSDWLHQHAMEIVEEFAELFLFLLVAITYVNTMEERRIFDVLRVRLVSHNLSYRQLFWLTGGVAFLLSGLLDNLTTALVVGAVVISVGVHSRRFVTLGCINIVVAANAGGAFSPFGDITTLMVWQSGKLDFWEFFVLFLPSSFNWLVPAALMHFALPVKSPSPETERISAKPGWRGVIVLFAATVATAVAFKNFLQLPPAIGMMLGLGYLQMWSYVLQRRGRSLRDEDMILDSFVQVQRVEWDTLLFFFGIIFAIGGLGVIGYLTLAANAVYLGLGASSANIIVGVLSAVIDNIPLMYAVLRVDPAMNDGQWLLLTLTCGVGGSLLSVGSAAGVALMGQAKHDYTFMHHLRWSWAIGLGYVVSIAAHLLINSHLF